MAFSPAESISKKVGEFRGSWSTPVLITEGDQQQLIISLPQRLYALDPATGKIIWSCDGLGDLVYTSPLITSTAVVAMSGYHGPSLAVKRGGQGDVTESHRLWHNVGKKENPQRVGSGVVVGDALYILNEPGIAWCMDTKTGRKMWEKRIGGKSWSSMNYVDGRIYIVDMDGTSYVLAANPKKYELLAKNEVDELTRASLVFSDGQVFQRTYDHLYCFEAK